MRYILIALGVLLLIIFGIVIFNRGGNSNKEVVVQKQAIKVTDFAQDADAEVSFSQEGPINAIENHRSVKITVSQTSRNITVFAGYQGQVLSTQTLPNDVDSYGAFLAALNRASFARERRLDANASSASVCPTGNRIHYVIVNDNKEAMNLWSGSCTTGSFGGNPSLTATLFRAQIPNYNQIVSGLNLTGNSSTRIY